MFNKFKSILLLIMVSTILCSGTNAAVKTSKPVKKVPATVQKTITAPQTVYETVNSLDVVAHPSKYLNKHVRIVAKFDKFSTLGLDYKPAYRSSEKYITFLIKRDDVINHTVPLSEMKNFLDRKVAEQYIDLKPGDIVEYSGLVFSNALGDVWIDVDKFNVLTQKDKKETSTK